MFKSYLPLSLRCNPRGIAHCLALDIGVEAPGPWRIERIQDLAPKAPLKSARQVETAEVIFQAAQTNTCIELEEL
jgi:hypothetical protein